MAILSVIFLAFAAVLIIIVLKISSQLNSQLSQMQQSLSNANKDIGQSLGNVTNIFGNVQKSLGLLEGSNRQMIEISKDIASLQELLRAPKLRGQIGETLLENLLFQVLPKKYYQMQYRFKSQDAVDAVIMLGERIVPVDAKFSLENFQKMTQADDEALKNTLRKKFIQDIKNRIDEIASKYILPQENTYDFALMYVPAENVYYEIIIKEELFSYSMGKKVIPVSPNTFYAYLQVICLGLKGLKIQENAREILEHLSMLTNEMAKFREDFEVLGKHLSNAHKTYDDSSRRLERFSEKMSSISDSRKEALLKQGPAE